MPAGDHLYRMNYQDFVTTHRKTGADITVAALPTDEKQATAFGLMKIDGTGRIQVIHRISYLLLHALLALVLPAQNLSPWLAYQVSLALSETIMLTAACMRNAHF